MKNVLEGMQILLPYYDKPDYQCGAEHDAIYAYPTDRPVSPEDLEKLIELGWFQPDTDYGDDEESGGDFAAKHYDPEEGWAKFT